MTAVVGPPGSVTVRIGGEEVPLGDLGRVEGAGEVEIEAEAFHLDSPRATLEREGDRLRVDIGG